jgi:hypothetical protein
LIVQNDGKLKSIVTSYDTSVYFRRRAEDIMYVEDIESAIKDFVRIAFTHLDDNDRHTLDEVIAELMSSDNKKKLQSALRHYLGRIGAGFDTEENIAPDDSRYARLAIWLQQRPLEPEKIPLTFKQIEDILGEELPISARQHRSWWANDSVGHVQSQQWLEVGWRVSSVSITDERVTFTRIRDREKMYIDFYSPLLPKLARAAQFPLREASPDGLSWILLGRVPNLTPLEVTSWQMKGLLPETIAAVGFLGYSFARKGRFRTECYIDCGDKERNKALFDKLCLRKSTIQAALEDVSGSLEWERIDDKRASRIALYHKGAITDSAEELARLREWAVDAMVTFQKVIDHQVKEILLHQQMKEEVEQRVDEAL